MPSALHRLAVLAPAGPADGLGESRPLELLSPAPIQLMSLRTAGAELPPGALLVVGRREDALAAAIARGRRIGFRLAALALATLVCASAAILLATAR